MELRGRFRSNRHSFKDRRCTDGGLLCDRVCFPRDGCPDFAERDKKLRKIGDNNRYERTMTRATLIGSTKCVCSVILKGINQIYGDA